MPVEPTPAAHTLIVAASIPATGPTGRGKLGIASAFLLTGILIALIVGTALLVILRRARWAHSNSADSRLASPRSKGRSRKRPDAWAESAARASPEPRGWTGSDSGGHAGDTGSDDDTVDIDPDELGPNDLGPNDLPGRGPRGRGR